MRRQRARELPLRAELFGVDQLARHAEAIAAQQPVVTGRASASAARPAGSQRESAARFQSRDARGGSNPARHARGGMVAR